MSESWKTTKTPSLMHSAFICLFSCRAPSMASHSDVKAISPIQLFQKSHKDTHTRFPTEGWFLEGNKVHLQFSFLPVFKIYVSRPSTSHSQTLSASLACFQ